MHLLSIWMNRLNAIQWSNYIVDGIVLLVMVGFAIYCGRRGFIDCFFSFVSTALSITLALALAKVVVDMTSGIFGLEGWLSGVFEKGFAKLAGFSDPIGDEGLKAALKGQNIPAVIGQLAMDLYKGEIPEGTTLATVLGNIASSLSCYLVTGLVLFAAIKLLLMLTKSLLEELIDRIEILDTLNVVLGVIVAAAFVVTEAVRETLELPAVPLET